MNSKTVIETVRAAKYYVRATGGFTRPGCPFLPLNVAVPLIRDGLLTYKNGKLRLNRNKSEEWIERYAA